MAQLSVTALIGIAAGFGVTVLGLLVFSVLFIRAERIHRRYMADLEERGVVIARTAQGAKQDTITKPRAVLRRNTILPFNAVSGWGTLPSVESINPPETPSVPAHYAPPKPAGFANRPSRLSWPFSAHRASGKAVHMKKIRVPVLPTVIESPKPSPLVPILSRYSAGGDPSSPARNPSRPSSDQSLLKRHPALRDAWQEESSGGGAVQRRPEPIRRSLTARPVCKPETRVRPNRSRSVAEIPLTNKDDADHPLSLPQPNVRTVSMCSQSSGHAPDAPIPPLPMEVSRLKSRDQRQSLLSRSPSHVSESSLESGHSSILAIQSSPTLPRSRNPHVHAVTKRDWRSSMVVGPRPIRDTLTLHGRNQRSQSSIESSTARFSVATPSKGRQPHRESRSSTITNGSSTQSIKLKIAESVILKKMSSPTCSPVTVRSYTPRRRSGCSVNAYGSPEERSKLSSTSQYVSGTSGILERQLSQASTQASSTRSSNGNPFQWDPAPLSSGKPSALKGSPSARKGHRRQNCVRISLAPTILGPPSRSPSPSTMHNIQEESPNASLDGGGAIGLGFSSTRSLPRPPSSSTFAPDLQLNRKSFRASLTPSSPALSRAPYDHGPIGSPVGSAQKDKRMSMGSPFTIPTFPIPCNDGRPVRPVASPPPLFALSRPSNEYTDRNMTAEPPTAPSSPFDIHLPDFNSSPHRPLLAAKYNPEHPGMDYDTPSANPARNFSSPFSIVPEEPSSTANRTTDYQQLPDEDSPPCSPKTLRPCSSPPATEGTLPEYSLQCPGIPEDTHVETIDPAMLSKDAFSTLNSEFRPATRHRDSVVMPTSPRSTEKMLEPLLQAAFASSPPLLTSGITKCVSAEGETQSPDYSRSSMYSCPSPSSSPSPIPCSPRPAHAQLPTPSLNFSEMPTLSPSLCGPRNGTPRPLRTSIAELRRMNSDAEKGGKDKAGRAERRYLRIGREDSIALPGEESYLDELDNGSGGSSDEGALDEDKGRRLVGNLFDWEEEATMLDLEEDNDAHDIGAGAQEPVLTATAVPNTDICQGIDQPVLSSTEQTNRTLPKTQPAPTANTEWDSKGDGNRSSSIWEDGGRFWQSTPPPPQNPPNSPNKPRDAYIPLSSSPLSTSVSKPIPKTSGSNRNSSPSTAASLTRRKRAFEVAKDEISPTELENRFRFSGVLNTEDSSNAVGGAVNNNSNRNSSRNRRSAASGNRYRKRSVLGGIGNPNVNVRIQIHPPSNGSLNMAGNGTPGSLYDHDGFLRA